ncbi:hypothetical protein O3G_MSEX004346 [Manduca sexta]|nr:hypothetical protein O3G_MSEX004346 [Manduca sexta]
MDKDNAPLPEHYTCMELFKINGPLRLEILENTYEAVFNAPWVTSISLPQSILSGFPVYPEYFRTQYANINMCAFNWYRGLSVNEKGNAIVDMHINWKLCGNGFTYTPASDDIGMKLKLECIPVNEITVGPAVETVSKNVVEAGPGLCPFETRHMFTSNKLNCNSFRCVSYNILADLYCDSDYTRTVLHPYCPPYALHIDYRKQLIMKELHGYNADILCLQEVDSKIFTHCLVPFFQSSGIEGSFYKKGKEVAEGLACFYRSDRFRLLGEETIILSKAIQTKKCLEPIWNSIQNNKPLTDRLLDRSTIASATFLSSIENPNEVLIVGNTHLYFHPDADHIRLVQGGMFIYWIMDVKSNLMEQFPDKRISVILCGDYNSVPSCGIYQLFTTGVASDTLADWRSNENEAVSNLSLKQSVPLESACGTPQYTNFTAEFADCLDYIFYEKTNLEVEQVIPFPSIEELKANIALPSVVFPSDHIALVADLHFVK